ncbi:MAG: factor-independent urate hydroxylase [Gemmatimonadota bacterium]
MASRLGTNAYGKSRIRLVRVVRDPAGDSVRDLVVAVRLEGAFEAAHIAGDNRGVLPTDTMKNTVYAFGARHALAAIEAFALELSRHFLTAGADVSRARVTIEEQPWEPIADRGVVYPHAFIRRGGERATCVVQAAPAAVQIDGGLTDLAILKTAGSGFAGFLTDAYTTLPETDDRLLGSRVSADWRFSGETADYATCRGAIRAALIAAFAEHDSRSVQHTLFAMGERALAACDAIASIHLSMPNLHHLPVDLAPFGDAVEGAVFVPVDEPHGLIEATVERG